MTMAAKLRAPVWWRALLSLPIGAALSLALVVGIRALSGAGDLFDGDAITTVVLIVVPLAFLIGIGCFDYWFRWASGAPTVPEDHSGHGDDSWRDYFRVNTDHKVIGIQYIVTTFFFFILGGLMAMLIRMELIAPGSQIVDANTYNGLFSVHASLMIFLFIIPVFAGIANYVIPLMIGAPDMAFPRLNALSFWLLPVAGIMMLASFFALAGSQFFVIFDRALGTHYFNPQTGGDAVMYQHVFWFYSHPAVYIMMLPGFGIVSEVISTHARKPVFGYRMMA